MANQVTALLDPVSRGPTLDCSLSCMGSILSFLVNADETGGGLSILFAHTQEGNEPPPHVHLGEHEIFYLVEGAVEYFCEGTAHSIMVQQGELIFLPQNKAHAFYFRTPEIKVLTILHAPDGGQVRSESFFRRMASGPAADMNLSRSATKFGTASADQIREVVGLAAEHDAVLLSPDEIKRRLPIYPGFGANRKAKDV